MFGLRSARSRAIAAAVLCLLLLAGVATTAAADRVSDIALWHLIGLSAAAFALAVATIAGSIVSTVRPLATLRASASAIADGAPEVRAQVSGPEGVASLARNLNQMTDTLLAKTEEYIDATNLTGVTLLRVDKDNRVTFLNDAMCEFLGRSREEILGTPIVEYLHPDDVASTTQAVRQMMKSKRLAQGIVSRYVTPMGTRVTEWNGYPIFDEQGRYAGVHGTGRDISEHRRVEEALRESEERFRRLSEAAFEAIAIHEKGKIVDANLTYAQMFRYEPSEVIGMNVLDFAAPESRDLVWQSILSKCEQPLEAIGLRKDGSTFLGEICGKAIPYRGRMVTVTAIRDITERKRVEEALRESEEKYRLLAENVTDVIWVMNTDLRFTYVSPSVTRLRGYTVEEAMGQTVKQVLTPASLEVVRDIIAAEQAIEQMEQKDLTRSLTLEVEQTCKDGSTAWTEVTLTFLRDSDGRPIDLLGITRDISERKRAEEALRESEDRHRAMFEQAADSIVLIDAETGELVQFNDRAHQALGYTREEFERLKIPDFEVIQPAEEVAKHIEKIVKEGADTFETKQRTKSGEIRDIQVSSRAVTLGGRHFIQGIWRDITERKRVEDALRESEERYRAIFEQAADSIVLIDAETGALVQFNDRAHQSLGYTRKEFERLKVSDFEVIESAEDVAKHIEKILKEGADVFETKHRTKSGEIRDIQVSGRAVTLGGRHFTQGIWRDITERKRAEQALRESEEKYRRLMQDSIDGIAVAEGMEITLVNRAFLEMFGYESEEEVVGHPFTNLVSPEYRELMVERGYARERGEDVLAQYEFKALRKDGSEFDAEISVSGIAYKGRLKRQAVIKDISERKRAEEAVRESEEKFRNIFQSASDAIMYLDTSGRFLDVNEKAVEVFGGPKEELLGKHFTTIGVFNLRDIQPLMTSFASVLGGEKASVEIRIKNRKGQERFLDCTGSALKVDGRTPGVVVVAARDITKRKQAEEALRAAREEIESRVERRMQQVDGYGLTFRELTILHLVAAGESDKEIAIVLGISPLTAHKHVANILEKMDAVSRTEAGVRALREGLLD
jgi:PAS domain S-box-containing protein